MEDRETIEKELWDRYNRRFESNPGRKYKESFTITPRFIIISSLVTWWICMAYIIFNIL